MTDLPDVVFRSSGALVRCPSTVILMLMHFLHWFGAVRAALVVEVPGIRQSNAARKRRKKVVEGVAGRAGRDTINGFSAELRRLGVTQKHSRPNHPTTCGKVERFH